MSKTGTVGMHGNTYEVDPELAGRQVDLVFDPLELAERRGAASTAGMSGWRSPLQIKRHVHPRAQPPVDAGGADRDRLPRPDRRTAVSRSCRSGSTTATCQARQPTALPATTRTTARRWRHEYRSAPRALGALAGRRSPRSWRPRCCSPPPLTRKRSPGSAGSSPSARWAWSAARSAPARPSPPGRRPRAWTRAGTRSSTCPTRRSARAGSTPRSSRARRAPHGSTGRR